MGAAEASLSLFPSLSLSHTHTHAHAAHCSAAALASEAELPFGSLQQSIHQPSHALRYAAPLAVSAAAALQQQQPGPTVRDFLLAEELSEWDIQELQQQAQQQQHQQQEEGEEGEGSSLGGGLAAAFSALQYTEEDAGNESTGSMGSLRSCCPPDAPAFGNTPIPIPLALAEAASAPLHAAAPTLASLAHMRRTPRGAVAAAAGERLPLAALQASAGNQQQQQQPQYRVASLFGKAVVARVVVAKASPSPRAPPAASSAARTPISSARKAASAASAAAPSRSPLHAFEDAEAGEGSSSSSSAAAASPAAAAAAARMSGGGATATAERLPPTPPPATSSSSSSSSSSLFSGARRSLFSARSPHSGWGRDVEAGAGEGGPAQMLPPPPSAAASRPSYASPLRRAAPAAAAAAAVQAMPPPPPPMPLHAASPEKFTRFRPSGRADPVARRAEMAAAWGVGTPSPVRPSSATAGSGAASPAAGGAGAGAAKAGARAGEDARAAAVIAILRSYNVAPEECVPGHPLWPQLKKLLASFPAAAAAAAAEAGGKGQRSSASGRAPFRPTISAVQAAPTGRHRGVNPA